MSRGRAAGRDEARSGPAPGGEAASGRSGPLAAAASGGREAEASWPAGSLRSGSASLLARIGLGGLPLTAFFLVWYAVGFVLQVFAEVPPALSFASGVFLVLYALSGLELLAVRTGWRRLAAPALLIAAGTFAVEWVGTHTGFPFGEYAYTDELGRMLSGVPWTMGLAWIGVIAGGALLSGRTSRIWRALETGLWVVLLDLVLDPVAEARGFWDWAGGGFYYGIPAANFVSWFIVGALLSLLLPAVSHGPRERLLALRLYQLMLLLFGLLALRAGLAAAFVLSLFWIALAEGRVRLDSRRQERSV